MLLCHIIDTDAVPVVEIHMDPLLSTIYHLHLHVTTRTLHDNNFNSVRCHIGT